MGLPGVHFMCAVVIWAAASQDGSEHWARVGEVGGGQPAPQLGLWLGAGHGCLTRARAALCFCLLLQTEQMNSDLTQSWVAACMWKLVTATSSNPCRDEMFSCYCHGQPCCCKGRSRLAVLPVAFTALYLPGNALVLG